MRFLHWFIPDKETVIPQELLSAGCPPLLAAMLHTKGLNDRKKMDIFLHGGPETLGDPLLLPDMDKAVERVRRAIADREKVAVYGDYDVDGITASCLMMDYLREKGLECELYIPDRIEEGYGLNIAAIGSLRDRGVTLIVTVDCGVTAVQEAEYAKSIGVDMVITDHHQCLDTLPGALAIVDPKRADSRYPYPECLAGVGVAFKLLCALENGHETVMRKYSDIISVGTIADIMPMLGENRYIVRCGMEKLRSEPNVGLKALISASGVEDRMNSAATVGFSLAPRINAAGRLGCVEKAVELLLTRDMQRAGELAGELCAMNRRRQELEQQVWTQAEEALGGGKPNGPVVLSSESWHQGVIGIAASKVTDKYGVPAVMICFDGETGKGSCRSVPGFDLFKALGACSQYLEGFGGHALAAGLSIKSENLENFRRAFAEYYRLNPPDEPPALYADLCIDRPELLDMRNVQSLSQLEPCGNGNQRPLVCITDALLETITPMGGGRSLRMNIRKFGQTFEAVFFSHTVDELGLKQGDYVDIVFGPQINDFRGRRSVQIMVTDMRKHDPEPLCRRILRGEEILTRDIWDILPNRSEFAAVWRGLDAAGDMKCISLAELRKRVCPTMQEAKICFCIAVFDELGLLTYVFHDNSLDIGLAEKGRKVDLNSSKLLCCTAERFPGSTGRG